MRTPAEILRDAKTIALVGASPKADRPSNSVMHYLLQQGYDVIPVRPAGCDEVLGVPCVRTLGRSTGRSTWSTSSAAPSSRLRTPAKPVEVGAGALWLQLGIVSDESRAIASAAGLDYVEDLAPQSCTGTRSESRRPGRS